MRQGHRAEALTLREREIVDLVSLGLSNKDVARQLELQEGTVKVHLHNIYEKTRVSNRTALVLWRLREAASTVRLRSEPRDSQCINVVVPFPAGGPSDVVARLVSKQMATILGQPIVIDNVSGEGGTVGSARVAGAPSDGTHS